MQVNFREGCKYLGRTMYKVWRSFTPCKGLIESEEFCFVDWWQLGAECRIRQLDNKSQDWMTPSLS